MVLPHRPPRDKLVLTGVAHRSPISEIDPKLLKIELAYAGPVAMKMETTLRMKGSTSRSGCESFEDAMPVIRHVPKHIVHPEISDTVQSRLALTGRAPKEATKSRSKTSSAESILKRMEPPAPTRAAA